eukprot:8377919-Pyramimonas_sp.AAC.1
MAQAVSAWVGCVSRVACNSRVHVAALPRLVQMCFSSGSGVVQARYQHIARTWRLSDEQVARSSATVQHGSDEVQARFRCGQCATGSCGRAASADGLKSQCAVQVWFRRGSCVDQVGKVAARICLIDGVAQA